MLYRIRGKISVRFKCPCPYCNKQDLYKDQEVIEQCIEAATPLQAKAMLLLRIKQAFYHKNVAVKWNKSYPLWIDEERE